MGSQQKNGRRSKKEAVLTVSVQEDERVVRQRGDGVGSDVEAELGLHDSEGLLGAGGKQAGVVETLNHGALAGGDAVPTLVDPDAGTDAEYLCQRVVLG